jgi:hypothetical protein
VLEMVSRRSKAFVAGSRRRVSVIAAALLLLLTSIVLTWMKATKQSEAQPPPVAPAVVVDGRLLRSLALGLELELPASWAVMRAPAGSQAMLRDSESDAVLVLTAMAVDDRTRDLDELLFRTIEAQRLQRVADIGDDRLGPLPARTVRFDSSGPSPRVGKMAAAKKAGTVLAVYCLVARKPEPDFAPCDRLLAQARWR